MKYRIKGKTVYPTTPGPRIIISGIELLPEEFAKTGKRITAGGGESFLDASRDDYKKRLSQIRKVLKEISRKPTPEEEIASLRELILFYQKLYREKDQSEENKILSEFKDFLIANKDTLSKAMQVDTEKANDTRIHGQSGRHNLLEDVWAWEQVNKLNRPMSEVYREWVNGLIAMMFRQGNCRIRNVNSTV